MDPTTADLQPKEPLVPIVISPPSPPFGGPWADSKIWYAGERLLELPYVEARLQADYRAAQDAWNAEADAADLAWATARQAEGPPTADALAAHTALVDTFRQRQHALNRQALLPIARYLVWKITDEKGVTYIGGPDQIGWDTLPTAALLWLTERGKGAARNELDGPFRR